MVKLGRLRTETGLDVAQALAAGQLAKCHAKKLIHAPEGTRVEVAAILGYQATKRVPRRELRDLSEYELADMHEHFPDKSRISPGSLPESPHGVQIVYNQKDQENPASLGCCWLVNVKLSHQLRLGQPLFICSREEETMLKALASNHWKGFLAITTATALLSSAFADEVTGKLVWVDAKHSALLLECTEGGCIKIPSAKPGETYTFVVPENLKTAVSVLKEGQQVTFAFEDVKETGYVIVGVK